MLLLATKILLELKGEWAGTIKILFQPAEEVIPGGALKMIDAGILENPNIECAIGQHVFPALPTGKVGIRPGKFMASSDNFFITIHGKGGHAAMPETLIDPVVIAGHIIVALQQLVSRHRSPKIPSVLSIGRVIAPGSNNVIPDEVTLDGTFRTLDNEWRERALGLLTKLVKDLCESMGAHLFGGRHTRLSLSSQRREPNCSDKEIYGRIHRSGQCCGYGYLDGGGRFCPLFAPRAVYVLRCGCGK